MKEIFDKYSKQIDDENFEDLLKDTSILPDDKYKFIELLADHYKQIGESLYKHFPGIDKELNQMNNSIEFRSNDGYYGERLWWMITGYGRDYLWPVYLYYYNNDPYYRVEQVEEEYTWYGEGIDWYICRRNQWDISRFKKYVSTYD